MNLIEDCLSEMILVYATLFYTLIKVPSLFHQLYC